MRPLTSIVMTSYRRAVQLDRTLFSIERQGPCDAEIIVVEDGDDGGATRGVCASHDGVRYIQRQHRPDRRYSNQSIPLNIGIQAARGDVLILQNAECMHASPAVIDELVYSIATHWNVAVFAAVLKVDQIGIIEPEPTNLASPYFFCGAIQRQAVVDLGGFDERFEGWGADDCDFGNRMNAAGICFLYRRDVIVHHQWHESVPRFSNGYEENRALMEARLVSMRNGGSYRANEGKRWGRIDG